MTFISCIHIIHKLHLKYNWFNFVHKPNTMFNSSNVIHDIKHFVIHIYILKSKNNVL